MDTGAGRDADWNFRRIEAELHALRRSNRRMKGACGLVLLAGVVTMVAGARSAGVPESLEAKRFVLRDEDGQNRATLSTTPEGWAMFQLIGRGETGGVTLGVDRDGRGELVFRDKDGGQRTLLCVSHDETKTAALALYDKDRRRRFHVAVMADGTSGISFLDAEGHPQATMATSADGPSFKLCDRTGEPRLQMIVSPDGSVRFVILDAKRVGRLGLGLTAGGDSSLEMANEAGKPQLILGLQKDGVVGINLRDQTNAERAGFDLLPSGKPRFYLLDQAGKPLTVFPVKKSSRSLP